MEADLPSVSDFGALYSEYPDLLLSRELSTAEVEVALTSILPGMRVATSAALEGIVAANAAALLSADDDKDWPARLTILYLPEDHGLGIDPHLTIGRLLATKLGVDVTIDVPPRPDDPYG
jgi:hypothetical protein